MLTDELTALAFIIDGQLALSSFEQPRLICGKAYDHAPNAPQVTLFRDPLFYLM